MVFAKVSMWVAVLVYAKVGVSAERSAFETGD